MRKIRIGKSESENPTLLNTNNKILNNKVLNINYTKKSSKKNYADFVSLEEKEYQSLLDKYGKTFSDRCIEILNNYKGACGKKYKSDYLAILNWVVKRVEEEGIKKQPKVAQKTEEEILKEMEELGRRNEERYKNNY